MWRGSFWQNRFSDEFGWWVSRLGDITDDITGDIIGPIALIASFSRETMPVNESALWHVTAVYELLVHDEELRQIPRTRCVRRAISMWRSIVMHDIRTMDDFYRDIRAVDDVLRRVPGFRRILCQKLDAMLRTFQSPVIAYMEPTPPNAPRKPSVVRILFP